MSDRRNPSDEVGSRHYAWRDAAEETVRVALERLNDDVARRAALAAFDSLLAERDEARRERDLAEEWHVKRMTPAVEFGSDMARRASAAEAEVARLREALLFYAEAESGELANDEGDLARAALASVGETE